MTGNLSDLYYLDDLLDGLDAREDVPRSHRIYANWWRFRTGGCLDDGQEDLAEHVATVIDTYLSPDHRSIADVRTTVAEHVDLDAFLHVSPQACQRVIEQVTIAAEKVVAPERPIEISPLNTWGDFMDEGLNTPEHAALVEHYSHPVHRFLDWLEDHSFAAAAFWMAVWIVGLVLCLLVLAAAA